MIAENHYYKDIPISLKELVMAYNSACPSMCKYEEYSYLPYILTSSILMEILLKRILFKVNGRFRGIHSPEILRTSFGSFGIKLRKFTKEEIAFLKLDHSSVRYKFKQYKHVKPREEMVDNLFRYFIDLAVELGVE